MIPFPLNENRFPFFCCRPSTSWPIVFKSQERSNPKSDKRFYHVRKWHNVQRAKSEMRCCITHALYQTKLWQQDNCQHPQNANLEGSTLEDTAQRIRQPFGGGGAEGHIIPPNIFEVSLKANTKVYLDVLKSVVIPWCNQVAGGRT